MFKFACLFLLVVYQSCYGYPTKGISGELTDVSEIQNVTHVITDAKHSTNYLNQTPNTFSSEKSQGFSKLDIGNQSISQGFSKLDIGNQSIWDIVIRLEALMNQTNGTDEMQGGAKKVVTKVKNKVKGGFDKVKNKVKVVIDKIKDKIGTGGGGGGGGSGGGGYGIRDNYHRRPYVRPTSGYRGGGGGGLDLTFLWVFLGLTIAGVAATVIYFMIRTYV